MEWSIIFIRSNDLHYSFKHSSLKFKSCTELKLIKFYDFGMFAKIQLSYTHKNPKTITKNIETLPFTENLSNFHIGLELTIDCYKFNKLWLNSNTLKVNITVNSVNDIHATACIENNQFVMLCRLISWNPVLEMW